MAKPPIKGRAGAPCRTCQHPKRREIDVRLARIAETAETISGIARDFGLNPDSLTRHHRTHLPKALAVVVDRHAELVAETKEMDVMASMGRASERVDSVLAACDEWLRDPVTGKYDLDPRAHEVEVIWRPLGAGAKRKEKLSVLLDRISDASLHLVRAELVRAAVAPYLEEEGLEELDRALRRAGVDLPDRAELANVEKSYEIKVADPRKLILEAATALKPLAELLGKARGQIKPDGPVTQVVNLMQHPDLQRIAQVHEQLTREHPEAGQRLAQLMRESAGAVVSGTLDVKQIGGRR